MAAVTPAAQKRQGTLSTITVLISKTVNNRRSTRFNTCLVAAFISQDPTLDENVALITAAAIPAARIDRSTMNFGFVLALARILVDLDRELPTAKPFVVEY